MKKSKDIFIIKLIVVIIIFIITFLSIYFLINNVIENNNKIFSKENIEKKNIVKANISKENIINEKNVIPTNENLKELDSKIADNLMINTFDEIISKKIKIDDWRLILVNFENDMPENFTVNLASIDEYRAVDSRIIVELMQMLKAMKADGASKIWVQSAYRSIDHQKELYDNRVKEYLAQGKSREEAEILTEQTINKPKSSEHNLGLAVDFNYIDYNFEKTAEYTWLLENARNYGFILRYPREKENITKVDFEPWHWRYVGAEHAKKITELDMCLEEYIEYLIDNQF